MNYLTQVLGIEQHLILEILSDTPLLIMPAQEHGRLELIAGKEVLTLLIGGSLLQDTDGETWTAEVQQSKVESS